MPPPTAPWRRLLTTVGNPGAWLQTDGDHALLVTADNAFAYQFDSYAGSGMPILVLEFRSGRFENTTRDHLDLVREDAARWWKNVLDSGQAGQSDGLGLIAPWVADECLLGEAPQAYARIDALEAQGKLTGEGPGSSWPAGAAYVRALHIFLRQHGYCS